MFGNVFQGRRVWLSGHTGFKGSWLAEWLLLLGAEVHGFALAPPTHPALFEQLGLEQRINHRIGDVRDASAVADALRAAAPDFVFHMAAQAIVRTSYERPAETYATNVMGTVNVLEALRTLGEPCAAVFVITDKCYENREWLYGYREEDPLGGHDPYSSSKAAAEIVIAAYRRSFFQNHPVKIASVRAGNVIGGGDWAKDRIIPDCIRALQSGRPIQVRNKTASRPWQHVLEPLGGYLRLAMALSQPEPGGCPPTRYATAFNFGPGHDANRTVAELVAEVLKHWPGTLTDASDPNAVHEAGMLQLATDKAHALLSWSPVWTFHEAIAQTVNWYRQMEYETRESAFQAITQAQIRAYCGHAKNLDKPWVHQ